jgi:hypothetical protein
MSPARALVRAATSELESFATTLMGLPDAGPFEFVLAGGVGQSFVGGGVVNTGSLSTTSAEAEEDEAEPGLF